VLELAEGKRKKRMTLPKKREDLDKIVREVSESHAHDHEHHHHHHHHGGDFDELITVMELLLDSLNANMKVLQSDVRMQAREIANIYRVLAALVRACFTAKSDDEKKRYLEEALRLVAPASVRASLER